MGHCKIDYLLLVLNIQKKKFTKTVNIYIFWLFLSGLIVVKINQVSMLENYYRNSIRPTISILAGCVKREWNIAYNVTFLNNDSADYA